jgi:hypothetical protein
MTQDQPENLILESLPVGDRSHWLEEALLLSEWLDSLCFAAAEMDANGWWRLGGRLRLARAGADGPLRQAAVRREEAVLLQRELLGRLEAGSLDRNAAQTGLARLTEFVPAMHREILRAAGSPWWRGGRALGRLFGDLGLKKTGFHAPTEDASAVMARFRRWKALPQRRPAGQTDIPTASPPEAWQKSQFHQWVLPLAEQGQWPAFGAVFRASERGLAAAHRDMPPSRQPLVSVIMAARNRAKTVAGAVRSVMDQTWPHWELIVCDDGSDDGTADAACAAGDARVRALRLTRGGAALARNRGLFEAQGAYIAYLDADNLWHPACLETMVRTLEERSGRWCAFARHVDATMAANGALRLDSGRALAFSYEQLSETNGVRLNSFFHRAELPRLFGGFTESLPQGHDWDLVLKYTFAQEPAYVDRYLALYRRPIPGVQASDTRHFGEEAVRTAITENVRGHYTGGLAGPGRGAKRRITLVSCDLRPGEERRGKTLAAALRAAGFDVREVCIAAKGLQPDHAWDHRGHLAKGAGGMVLCIGTLPQTLGLGLAASAKYGEGLVLDLGEADMDDAGSPAEVAAQVAVWTTGNPRVDRMLQGRATFLGGYEGDGVAATGPDARRVLWAGRSCAEARPTPAELALRVDLPEQVITDRPTDPWGVALFWPEMMPAPRYSVDPFVLARAFATGAPVILGDPAGPDELARQEVLRWVSPEDDEALRDAIDEALARGGATRERAANARRLFQRQYGVRAATAQFAVVWERAMAAAPKTSTPPGGRRRPK